MMVATLVATRPSRRRATARSGSAATLPPQGRPVLPPGAAAAATSAKALQGEALVAALGQACDLLLFGDEHSETVQILSAVPAALAIFVWPLEKSRNSKSATKGEAMGQSQG